jgi:hypothetical protein
MVSSSLVLPISQRISLPGHFDTPVILEEARLVESLDDEIAIALMRVSTRRMFEAIPDDAPPLEAVKCLDNIGLMCIRIARLSLIRYKMQGEPVLDFESLLKLELD